MISNWFDDHRQSWWSWTKGCRWWSMLDWTVIIRMEVSRERDRVPAAAWSRRESSKMRRCWRRSRVSALYILCRGEWESAREREKCHRWLVLFVCWLLWRPHAALTTRLPSACTLRFSTDSGLYYYTHSRSIPPMEIILFCNLLIK